VKEIAHELGMRIILIFRDCSRNRWANAGQIRGRIVAGERSGSDAATGAGRGVETGVVSEVEVVGKGCWTEVVSEVEMGSGRGG